MYLPMKKLRTTLVKRIDELKRRFYFTQPTSGITPHQEDKLRGLIVLCHAELEDYFESVAKTILDRGEMIWNTKKIANFNFANLLLRGKRADKPNLKPGMLLFKVVELYKYVIINNNGIKADNLHNLFWPLGYDDDDDFDSSFLAQLDSFGVQRGNIVHSSAKKAKQQLDQSSVYRDIDNILNALEGFERVIISKIT